MEEKKNYDSIKSKDMFENKKESNINKILKIIVLILFIISIIFGIVLKLKMNNEVKKQKDFSKKIEEINVEVNKNKENLKQAKSLEVKYPKGQDEIIKLQNKYFYINDEIKGFEKDVLDIKKEMKKYVSTENDDDLLFFGLTKEDRKNLEYKYTWKFASQNTIIDNPTCYFYLEAEKAPINFVGKIIHVVKCQYDINTEKFINFDKIETRYGIKAVKPEGVKNDEKNKKEFLDMVKKLETKELTPEEQEKMRIENEEIQKQKARLRETNTYWGN